MAWPVEIAAAAAKVIGNVAVPLATITAPPCPHCRWWNPTAVSDSQGIVIGIRMCHAPAGQKPDYSCYEEQKK